MQGGKSVPVINVCGSRFVAKGINQTTVGTCSCPPFLIPIEITPTQGTYPVTVRYEGQAQAGSFFLATPPTVDYISLTWARCTAATDIAPN